jgi:hypothetical protein
VFEPYTCVRVFRDPHGRQSTAAVMTLRPARATWYEREMPGDPYADQLSGAAHECMADSRAATRAPAVRVATHGAQAPIRLYAQIQGVVIHVRCVTVSEAR